LLERIVLVLRFFRGTNVAAFAVKATLAGMPLAMCLALSGLAPAMAEERQTIVLTPTSQQTASHKKVAYATAKWLTVKSDHVAEILLSETDYTSAVQVVAGTVTVRNKLDHSVIRISAGTAYETNVRPDPIKRDPVAFNDGAAETIALFETKSNTSYLYRMNEPGRMKAEIIDPPMTQNYSIGDVAASKLPMSRMLTTHFPPAGVVVWHPPTPALAEQSKAN
jgi:hypothetical protein